MTKLDCKVMVRSERRIPVVMSLVFLPWFAMVLFAAGGWAALNFLAYACVVSLAGYGVISLALPAPARAQGIVFASRRRYPCHLGAFRAMAQTRTSPYMGSDSLARAGRGRGTRSLGRSRCSCAKDGCLWRRPGYFFRAHLRGVLPSIGSQ